MKKLVFFLVWTLILFHLEPLTAAASKDEERTAKLIEGAKKEAALLFYTASDITDALKLTRAFQEKYPFIKVDIVRTGSEGILARVLAEASAKKLHADVITSSEPHVSVYKKKNIMLEYRSPEAVEYPASAKDPEGCWTNYYDSIYVTAYNTKLVSPKEVPKSYDDLLLPRWKGKLAMDRADARWYGALDQIWGRKKNLDFMTKLARNNPIVRNGKPVLLQLLGAGEFEIATILYLDNVEESKNKGASIDWVYLDPVITSGHMVWIPTTAPHKNTAKLFIDFLLSEEGEEVLSSFGKFVMRPTANTDRILSNRFPQLNKQVLPKRKHAMPPEVSERYTEYSTQFRALFMR